MNIDLTTTASLLRSHDNILIITHASPDCDTLGSGFGLYYSLKKLKKRCKVVCSDPFPEKYRYFIFEENFDEFDPEFVICVDAADAKLLGEYQELYDGKIDLCIDHHVSNKLFVKKTYLDAKSSSTCEIIYKIISELGVELDPLIASSLYSGIVTDTGCFKYSNVTRDTHLVASELLRYDFDSYLINYNLFECKTKERIKIECEAINSIEYYHDERCAIMTIPMDMVESLKVDPEDIDGLAAIPRAIKGVLVGITIKRKAQDQYKISVRTMMPVDASAICSEFGGGGHKVAAGCLIKDSFENVKARLVCVAKKHLGC